MTGRGIQGLIIPQDHAGPPSASSKDKMIYITSFQKAHQLPNNVEVWSAAVYQPKGFNLPKADWCDIRNENGVWIRPREFLSEPKPLQAYREKLLWSYESKSKEASIWINQLQGDAALCCWCPYERAAQRQIKEHGSFVCHTAVLGEFLSTRLNQKVWYDSDRLRMAVLTQE